MDIAGRGHKSRAPGGAARRPIFVILD